MKFEHSTQARDWLFDPESLSACRRRAVTNHADGKTIERTKPRKFASGFHHRYHAKKAVAHSHPTISDLSVDEQEMLVRFHAHQILTLVGPTAILAELRSSEIVASTAITFFRRFYLSNSVTAIHPRKIAVACAFFASKVEEERVEIDSLAHATVILHAKVRTAPLCRRELCAVTVHEIQRHERLLMEGLNYEFRCHHPHEHLPMLASGISHFLSKDRYDFDEREPTDQSQYQLGDQSPRAAAANSIGYTDEPLDMAYEVSQNALIFSDAPFLYAPKYIALASIALAIEALDQHGQLNDTFQHYIRESYSLQPEEDVGGVLEKIVSVAYSMIECPSMELKPTRSSDGTVAKRAESLRDVLDKVANIRLIDQMRHYDESYLKTRQRKRSFEVDYSSYTPYYHDRHYPRQRISRVTPTTSHFY